MKVINLFAGPGAGKSTTAAGLFAKMKRAGYNVELVTEYAKDLTWEGRFNVLSSDQLYVFANQHRRLHRLRNQVEWIITDSPLLLSDVYAGNDSFYHLSPLIMEAWGRFNNINYYLDRKDRKYMQVGRSQTAEQAKEIDQKVLKYLLDNYIDFKVIDSSGEAAEEIYDDLNV